MLDGDCSHTALGEEEDEEEEEEPTTPAVDTSKSRLSVAERKRRAEGVSEEEMEACWVVWKQLCDSAAAASDDDGDVDGPPIGRPDDGEHSASFAGILGESDRGVEVEMTMTVSAMLASLGVIGPDLPWMHRSQRSLPHSLWARKLSPDAASKLHREWDDKAKRGELSDNPSQDWRQLSLRWCQVVGVHAILRRLIQGDQKAGILVADDVGVGKTGQALAVMALLAHYRDQELAGVPLSGMAAGTFLPHLRDILPAAHPSRPPSPCV